MNSRADGALKNPLSHFHTHTHTRTRTRTHSHTHTLTLTLWHISAFLLSCWTGFMIRESSFCPHTRSQAPALYTHVICSQNMRNSTSQQRQDINTHTHTHTLILILTLPLTYTLTYNAPKKTTLGYLCQTHTHRHTQTHTYTHTLIIQTPMQLLPCCPSLLKGWAHSQKNKKGPWSQRHLSHRH